MTRELRRLGFFVCRFGGQARATRQTPGIPDCLALHAVWKLALWIEWKTAATDLSPAQREWHRIAQAAGQTVIVARRPADLLAPLVALGAPVEALNG
jgi:hypothetical protein